MAGSIDDVVDGLRRYVEAGATDIRLGITSPNPETEAHPRAELAALIM